MTSTGAETVADLQLLKLAIAKDRLCSLPEPCIDMVQQRYVARLAVRSKAAGFNHASSFEDVSCTAVR